MLTVFAVNWNLDMPTLADYIILDYDVYKGVLDDMQVLQRCIGFLLVSHFSSFVFEFWFSGYRAFLFRYTGTRFILYVVVELNKCIKVKLD